MPRSSNWNKQEESAKDNGEFAQHEIDDPAVDTDSNKAVQDRQKLRKIDGHGKTPRQAAIAKEAESPAVDPIWLKASVLAEKRLAELRGIAEMLLHQLVEFGIEPGDLVDRSKEGMLDNILRERKRLRRAKQKALASS